MMIHRLSISRLNSPYVLSRKNWSSFFISTSQMKRHVVDVVTQEPTFDLNLLQKISIVKCVE